VPEKQLPITRVLQKQGISGLLNICTTIIIGAKFKLLNLEALPSQSPKPLFLPILQSIPNSYTSANEKCSVE